MSNGSDPDDTLTESPWAKQVRAAVRKEMSGVESRLVDVLMKLVEPRFDSTNMELAEIRQRVTRLEQLVGVRDTLPPASEQPEGG